MISCARRPRRRGDARRRSRPASSAGSSAAEHEPRLAVVQDERAVGQRRRTATRAAGAHACAGSTRSPWSCSVDRVGAGLARVELAPDRAEAVVVLAPAERARAMPGRERGRLVEEEELREPPGLEQRPPQPAAELEPAGDPAPAVVAPADAARSRRGGSRGCRRRARARDRRRARRAASRGSAAGVPSRRTYFSAGNVEGRGRAAALALLPRYVARRTVPIEVRNVEIP